jgi:hypothetical protein
MAAKEHSGIYHAIVTSPERVYPFANEVQGQWVRGVRSYDAALQRAFRKYGTGHYGYQLMAYRQFCHFVGAVLFLIAAAYVSESLLGSTKALYAFLIVAILFISFQEFYLHPRMYQQIWKKGLADWLTWCVPMGLYLFIHLW